MCCDLPFQDGHQLTKTCKGNICGTVINFVDCGFIASYYKVFIYTYSTSTFKIVASGRYASLPKTLLKHIGGKFPYGVSLWH
jgi:hypothetical protein